MKVPIHSMLGGRRRITVPKGFAPPASSRQASPRRFAALLVVSILFHFLLGGLCWAVLPVGAPAARAEYAVNILYGVAPAPPVELRPSAEPPAPRPAMPPPGTPESTPTLAHAEPPRGDPAPVKTANVTTPFPAPLPKATTPSALKLFTPQPAVAVAQAAPVAAIGPADPGSQAGGDPNAAACWAGVRQAILNELRYPQLPAGAAGNTNIVLRITLDRRGRLVEVRTPQVSGDSPFARAAVRATRRAAPFTLPAGGGPAELTAELPIRFVSTP